MTTAPACEIMVWIYVSFTPRLSHPRSVYGLKCSVYSGILTCSRVIYNCMHSTVNSKGDWSYTCSCSFQVTCHCACVNQKQPMGFRTVLLFYDVHIDIGMTLNLPQSSCMRVICGCRAIQTNSAETSLALLQCSYYCHNVISSGSPPVFLECTSNTYMSKLTLLCIHTQ